MQIGIVCIIDADEMCLKVIAGERDPRDATSFDASVADEAFPKGLSVGLPKEFLGEGLDPECRAAVERARQALEGLGARTGTVSLPRTAAGIPTYYLVATVEAASNLARFDGVHFGQRRGEADFMARTRGEGFGPEVKRRILLGTFASSVGHSQAYYGKALQARSLIREDFDAAFRDFDVLLTPTTPTPAFRLAEKIDPIQMYLSDIYTVTANLAGIPGLAMPCGVSIRGMPLGIQLLGPARRDARLMAVAAALEGALA